MSFKKIFYAGCMFACTSMANADMVLNFDCITPNNATNCAIGEAQLSTSISAFGVNQVLFRILNSGAAKAIVSEVYFDNGPLLNIASLIDKDEGVGGLADVDFTGGSATPSNLPNANNIAPEFVATHILSADADSPSPKNGIGAGEWLGIVFNIMGNGTVNNVYNDIVSGDLRVGLHVKDFNSGMSASFVNASPVPLPAAVWFFVTALVGGYISIRKKIAIK